MSENLIVLNSAIFVKFVDDFKLNYMTITMVKIRYTYLFHSSYKLIRMGPITSRITFKNKVSLFIILEWQYDKWLHFFSSLIYRFFFFFMFIFNRDLMTGWRVIKILPKSSWLEAFDLDLHRLCIVVFLFKLRSQLKKKTGISTNSNLIYLLFSIILTLYMFRLLMY